MKSKLLSEIKGIVQSEDFSRNPCFYIYDLEEISKKSSYLKSILPANVHVYYAIKANSNMEILQHIRKDGFIHGAEIASGGELDIAKQAFSPDQIIFTGPGKNLYELRQSVESGIKHVNLESYVEAIRLGEISTSFRRSMDVLVRININHRLSSAHTQMAGFSSKLGIDEEICKEEIAKINSIPRIDVRGIHVFGGSGILDYTQILAYFEHVLSLAESLEQEGLPIKCIDLGGGFGIDYTGRGRQLDVESLSLGLGELIGKYSLEKKELILELGRYLVGESGYYVTEIIDIKESQGKKHIISAGGINHQRRPCAVEQNHPVEIIQMGKPALYGDQPLVNDEIVDIDGPLCLTDDILGRDVHIPHAEIGDLVVIKDSGAYGLGMAAVNFLNHPLPKEYFVR